MNDKKWYLSKTLRANVVMFIGIALNAAFPTFEISPEFTAGIFAVVNGILRAVTKDKLVLS